MGFRQLGGLKAWDIWRDLRTWETLELYLGTYITQVHKRLGIWRHLGTLTLKALWNLITKAIGPLGSWETWSTRELWHLRHLGIWRLLQYLDNWGPWALMALKALECTSSSRLFSFPYSINNFLHNLLIDF